MLGLAAAMAPTGGPLCVQDFAEVLGVKTWEAEGRVYALRASHPGLWKWTSYPNGARSAKLQALRKEQRALGEKHLAEPLPSGASGPGSLAVLRLVAKVRRARAERADAPVEIARRDCAFAAEMLELLARGNGRSAREGGKQADILRTVAARLRAAAAWDWKIEGAPR